MRKQLTPNRNFPRGSLHDNRSARTVLLRMAADQERADRIRALKQERPDLTWRRIADHVGVSERAATDWQKKGGIEYENAKKLAQIFEVDVDYIWRGADTGTPDPFPPAGQHDTEDRIQAMETRLLEQAGIIRALLDVQNELLARQSRILERIEKAIEREDEAARRDDESARRLQQAADRAAAMLQAASQTPAPASRTRAKSSSPQG